MSGTGFTKLSRVLAKAKEGDLFFECPGCDMVHGISTGAGPALAGTTTAMLRRPRSRRRCWSDTVDLLAELRSEADGYAGQLAAALTESRRAGFACERSYDSVRGAPRLLNGKQRSSNTLTWSPTLMAIGASWRIWRCQMCSGELSEMLELADAARLWGLIEWEEAEAIGLLNEKAIDPDDASFFVKGMGELRQDDGGGRRCTQPRNWAVSFSWGSSAASILR